MSGADLARPVRRYLKQETFKNLSEQKKHRSSWLILKLTNGKH